MYYLTSQCAKSNLEYTVQQKIEKLQNIQEKLINNQLTDIQIDKIATILEKQDIQGIDLETKTTPKSRPRE